jgi:hypothetical protein
MLLVSGTGALSRAIRTLLLRAVHIEALNIREISGVSMIVSYQENDLISFQSLWEALKLTQTRSVVCVGIWWYLVPRWRHSRLRPC